MPFEILAIQADQEKFLHGLQGTLACLMNYLTRHSSPEEASFTTRLLGLDNI
jgi:hypothetical protein